MTRLRISLGIAAASLVATATVAVLNAAPAAAAPAPPAPVPCVGCWRPALRTSWNWVLSIVPHAPYRPVSMYDVDGFDNSAADVSSLHGAGIKAVCYISAGSWENWRPDAGQFPAALLGRSNGWPGEKWLDIREIQSTNSVLRSIMDARLDMCKQKGFDMVEPDNVDVLLQDASTTSRYPPCSRTSTARSTSSATSTGNAPRLRTAPSASTSTSPRASRSSRPSTRPIPRHSARPTTPPTSTASDSR